MCELLSLVLDGWELLEVVVAPASGNKGESRGI